MKNTVTTFVATMLAGLVLPAGVLFAQGYINPVTVCSDIPTCLLALVDLVFLIGVPIVVVFIVYAGFLFVTAGDNEAQISRAKMTFLWTIVGAGVLLGAKALAAAIGATVLTLGP